MQGAAQISKFLSFVLRHAPHSIGIELDPQGWVSIDRLLTQSAASGRNITREMLVEVVETNSKRRFAVSEDGLRIRASQGHSVQVELGYRAMTPPALLFHGTATNWVGPIRERGLDKMQRHHVHLSADPASARAVGARHGRPVVLRVQAGRMDRDGYQFFQSDNGVWLTDAVPPEYIDFI